MSSMRMFAVLAGLALAGLGLYSVMAGQSEATPDAAATAQMNKAMKRRIITRRSYVRIAAMRQGSHLSVGRDGNEAPNGRDPRGRYRGSYEQQDDARNAEMPPQRLCRETDGERDGNGETGVLEVKVHAACRRRDGGRFRSRFYSQAPTV